MLVHAAPTRNTCITCPTFRWSSFSIRLIPFINGLRTVDEGIDAAVDLLEVHQQHIDMFDLSLTDACQLLKFVLNSNFFAFN